MKWAGETLLSGRPGLATCTSLRRAMLAQPKTIHQHVLSVHIYRGSRSSVHSNRLVHPSMLACLSSGIVEGQGRIRKQELGPRQRRLQVYMVHMALT